MKIEKAQWVERLGCSGNHKNLELARTKQIWSWDKAKIGTDSIKVLDEMRVCSLSMKCLPYAKHFYPSMIQGMNKAGMGPASLSLHLSK